MADEDTAKGAGLDGLKPDSEPVRKLRVLVNKYLGPYTDLQHEAIDRVIRLLAFAGEMEHQLGRDFQPVVTKPTTPADDYRIRQWRVVQEMLRAAVVLTHAYLEDYLRTIAEVLLPQGDEDTLNAIPLVGLSGRPEKFPLGKLVRHKGKQVDEVLRESVREHLSRTTFNNKGEIVKLLETLGLGLPEDPKPLETIQEMIQRRHQIVHRADKAKPTHSEAPVLQPINAADATRWLQATHDFLRRLDLPLLDKLTKLQQKPLTTTTPK